MRYGHNDFNSESLTINTKQWPEPIILRYNGQERKVFLEVDWDNQAYDPKYEEPENMMLRTLQNIQVTLPLGLYLKNKLGSR